MLLAKHFLKFPAWKRTIPVMSRFFCGDKGKADNVGCCCQCADQKSLFNIEPAGIATPAPDFKAKAWHDGFKDINLSDYKGKYVVLFFYPLDFTFVCPTEIIEFSKKSPKFRETSNIILLMVRLRGNRLFS